MQIYNFGTNHKYLEVDKREKISFAENEINPAIQYLTRIDGICEATVISTCNRVEFLLVLRKELDVFAILRDFLIKFKKTDILPWKDSFYLMNGEEAVRHTFRVATSIDSMVVGEADILHQIKDAYRHLQESFPNFIVLDRLVHAAVTTGKRARSETSIGAGKVSVSSASVDFIHQMTGDLAGKKILVMGAGKMGSSLCRYLQKSGATDITIVNRSPEKARKIAKELNIQYGEFEHYPLYFTSVDVAAVSIHYEGYLLDRGFLDTLEKSREKGILILDISVPRVVEENTGGKVQVFDIESLNSVIQDGEKFRLNSIIQVNRIIEENLKKFSRWTEELIILPAIIEIRQRGSEIIENTLKKKGKNIPPEYHQEMEEISLSILNRLMQTPIEFLREKVITEKRTEYLGYFQQFFQLIREEDPMLSFREKRGELKIVFPGESPASEEKSHRSGS